jgi:hypothetical protein
MFAFGCTPPVAGWSSAQEPWLPPGAWEACRSELRIPVGATVLAAVDIGRKRDSSAIVVAAKVDERIVVQATVFESPGCHGDESSDLALVEEELRELAGRYDLIEAAFDPWSFTRSAQLLADEGMLMVEFPQNRSRMAPASEAAGRDQESADRPRRGPNPRGTRRRRCHDEHRPWMAFDQAQGECAHRCVDRTGDCRGSARWPR